MKLLNEVRRHIFTILITVMFFLVFTVALVPSLLKNDAYQSGNFSSERITLDTGWDYYEDGILLRQNASLPVSIPAQSEFTLKNRLKEPAQKFHMTPVLFLEYKYMECRIYLDQELLRIDKPPENGYTGSAGVSYLIVPLPDDWAGRELTITGTPLLSKAISYDFNAPVLTPGIDLLYQTMTKEFTILLSDIIIAFLGVVLLISSLVLYKSSSIRRTLFYIGLFAVLFMAYDLCLTATLHFLIGNTYALYLLEMLTLMAITSPILMLAREFSGHESKFIINIGLMAVIINFFIQISIHFLFRYEFRQMLIFTHAAILISLVVIIISYIKESRQNTRQKQFVFSMIPLLIGSAADIVRFYLNWSEPLNLMFRIGTFLFVVFQLFFILQSYFNVYKRSVESAFYKKLALFDTLTQLGNRAAYERNIGLISEKLADYSSIWCISVDINNLKDVNDRKGHLAGDELIKRTASILNHAVKGTGKAYRVGGDEFIIVFTDLTEADVTACVERMFKEMAASLHTDTPISFSCGFDCYKPDDHGNMEKMYSRADAKMYELKQKYKEQGNHF